MKTRLNNYEQIFFACVVKICPVFMTTFQFSFVKKNLSNVKIACLGSQRKFVKDLWGKVPRQFACTFFGASSASDTLKAEVSWSPYVLSGT